MPGCDVCIRKVPSVLICSKCRRRTCTDCDETANIIKYEYHTHYPDTFELVDGKAICALCVSRFHGTEAEDFGMISIC